MIHAIEIFVQNQVVVVVFFFKLGTYETKQSWHSNTVQLQHPLDEIAQIKSHYFCFKLFYIELF